MCEWEGVSSGVWVGRVGKPGVSVEEFQVIMNSAVCSAVGDTPLSSVVFSVCSMAAGIPTPPPVQALHLLV